VADCVSFRTSKGVPSSLLNRTFGGKKLGFGTQERHFWGPKHSLHQKAAPGGRLGLLRERIGDGGAQRVPPPLWGLTPRSSGAPVHKEQKRIFTLVKKKNNNVTGPNRRLSRRQVENEIELSRGAHQKRHAIRECPTGVKQLREQFTLFAGKGTVEGGRGSTGSVGGGPQG